MHACMRTYLHIHVSIRQSVLISIQVDSYADSHGTSHAYVHKALEQELARVHKEATFKPNQTEWRRRSSTSLAAEKKKREAEARTRELEAELAGLQKQLTDARQANQALSQVAGAKRIVGVLDHMIISSTCAGSAN